MSVVVNEVRRGTYLDSVALMRIAQAVKALPGVVECGLMMGTPANRQIMADAGVLAEAGAAAGPGDLVIAIGAADAETGRRALAEAREQLDKPRVAQGAGGAAWAPRTLRSALQVLPDASLALISVPGAFAAAEATKAINRGLNVMLFSDNVPLEDEVRLKRLARDRGVLVMGPDCGTAIIGGKPLAFANVVTRGDIGIVGASGTGIQEVSCLIDAAGHGISHAIGTGGRDLKAEVGAITTLMAIDLLDADPATRHIVVLSKPPAASVADAVLARVGRSRKTFTIGFIGAVPKGLSANAKAAATLEDAARLATGQGLVPMTAAGGSPRAGGLIRGLFAGGTLCAEAQVILRSAGLSLTSNAPIDGVAGPADGTGRHSLIDLGDDEYTQGRPHPMIEPAVRDAPLREALADAGTRVVLVDCVLGYGAAADPAGYLARVVLSGRRQGGPRVIASVTGTERDPQCRSEQVAILERAGIRVADTNAQAAREAVAELG